MNYHEKYNSFYNSQEWKDLRDLKFGEADGFCEECSKLGLVVEGREVHHIKPIEERWDLRLEYSNLILLCDKCHRNAHGRISLYQKFLKEWEEI